MPLVYDTHIARRCQPHSPLPSHLLRAGGCPRPAPPGAGTAREVFGHRARGLWPSEGSIAPEIVPLMVEAGFDYFCSDEGNLFKSLKNDPAVEHPPYRPHRAFPGLAHSRLREDIQALFRERPLSDFIGFDAARNETSQGRRPSHRQSQEHRQGRAGRSRRRLADPDGENAWEAFPDSGEAFLTSFYRALTETPGTADLPPRRLFRRASRRRSRPAISIPARGSAATSTSGSATPRKTRRGSG